MLLGQVLPPVSDQLAQGITMRFRTTSAFTGVVGINFYNLLDTWIIAGTATNGYQLWDFVKVRRVTVRAGTQVGGAGSTQTPSATVSVEFPGLVIGASGSGRVKTTTSLTPVVPAVATLTPGHQTSAGLWQPSSNDTAFVIRAVDNVGGALIGAIVDVEMSFKNSPLVTPQAVASAISGATPGQIYFGSLDGARIAASAVRTVFALSI